MMRQFNGDWSNGRGTAAAAEWRRRHGMTGPGQPLWTDDELAALRQNWTSPERLRRALPRRTDFAIWHKGAKLGLPRKKRNHIWTCPEVRRLKELWPEAPRGELLAAFPWAKWEDLHNKAQDLRRHGADGLRRPRGRLVPTGHEVTDQLLSRVKEDGLTLRDLDEMAGTGTHFQAGRYRYRLRWAHLAAAIDAMGGEIVVKWSDDELRNMLAQ
jgi:hypothetical protein